ncbi:MAG: hypothetical protein GX131_20520 [candidate division WS1 bacterium]|nr:hypothetical protein [candidate division WS1 bacterium]
MYPGRCRPVVAAGVLAVLLVNLRLGPTGPHWPAAPVAYSVVAWWPAQTDQMSLLMSLIALLALDRWLLGEDPRGLLKAGLLWVAAVLFKEMAVVLPLLAGVLMLMRRGRGILRLREADDEGIRRFSPGIAWRFIFPALVAVALFLFARAQIVPEAWGIEPRGEASLAMKAVFLLFSRPWMVLVAHGAWVAVAAAVNATLITIYIYSRKRPSVVWLILALIIVNGLIAEVLGGNFALLTVPIPLGALGTLTLLALGLIALAHVREGWLWGLLGMALLVHLPLINVSGPHYFYWPAAFWGLFNAGLWLWTLPRIRGDARNRPQTGLSGNVTPELDSSSGEGL